MRALCGAIITAGAMIGLGLTALGFGIRFQGSVLTHGADGPLFGIPTMTLILVILVLCVLIGIGIAFLGLMYHHQRRHFELHGHGHLGRPEGSATTT